MALLQVDLNVDALFNGITTELQAWEALVGVYVFLFPNFCIFVLTLIPSNQPITLAPHGISPFY